MNDYVKGIYDEVEYPQCFIIRENASEDAIWFVKIMNKAEDLQLQPYHQDYIYSLYTVEVTTLAEAETYHAFDIAPIGDGAEFISWLESGITRDVKKYGNIITGTPHVGEDSYPSYYLVLLKDDHEAKPVCVYPIKSEEQNIEMPISWWEGFSGKMYIQKIEYNEFEHQIAMNRVYEYNTKELLDRVGELTKKGA